MFSVTIPVSWHSDVEHPVKYATWQAKTEEQAKKWVEDAKEKSRTHAEYESVRKWCHSDFFNIQKVKDGYEVTVPGGSTENGDIIAKWVRVIADWDEAKKILLHEWETRESLGKKPILELVLETGESVSFSDMVAFDPDIAPTTETYPVSKTLREALLQDPDLSYSGFRTYAETIKQPEWDKKLFDFVQKYLDEVEPGMLASLEIKDLRALTPKQAVELSTRIVLRLTKYNYNELGDKQGETAADTSSALVLLEEGLRQRNNPTWQGNGVCRNFTDMAKAVFESLKMQQTKVNALRNVYCVHKGGGPELYNPSWETRFDPEMGLHGTAQDDRVGHAWNMFVAVSREGSTRAIHADVTWGERDFGTGHIAGLDHTLLRMEPALYEMMTRGNMRKQKRNVEQTLAYYALQADRPVAGVSERPDEPASIDAEMMQRLRRYYALRGWEIVRKTKPETVPPELVSHVMEQFAKQSEFIVMGDLERFYAYVSTKKTGSNLFEKIWQTYMKQMQIADVSTKYMTQDAQFQREIIERIKSEPEFQEALVKDLAWRVRVREVMPQLFSGASNTRKEEDRREMAWLIRKSRMLDQLGIAQKVDRFAPTEEQLKKAIADAMALLDLYNKGSGPYDMLKYFDQYYKETQKNKEKEARG